ncbi:hypothetical protein, partial [Staphylococcus lugdunensis]|uniref:hypothetical protein n=1 Tax=Staphylococcus lugdunensis TaxID=28035 RepID=UPI0030C09D84
MKDKIKTLIELIDGLPKYEWDRIVDDINREYSHKTVKVKLESSSSERIKKLLCLYLDETRMYTVMSIINFNIDVIIIEKRTGLFFIYKIELMFRYSNRGVNMIPDKYRDEKDYRKIPRQYLEPNIPKGRGSVKWQPFIICTNLIKKSNLIGFKHNIYVNY